MDSLQLEDLALFNGDLLSVGLMSPLTAPTEGLSSFVDEGLLGLGQQDSPAWGSVAVKAGGKPADTETGIITELLGSPQTNNNDDLLGSDWLDTQVDLVEYVGADIPSPIATEVSDSEAARLLDSLSQAVAASQGSPTAPSPLSIDTTSANVDMMEVLTKLTDAMDQNYELQPEKPSIDVIELPCEPILSPMSAEEVESILSSSPTSPGNSSIADDSGFADEYSASRYETVDPDYIPTLSSGKRSTAGGPQKATKSRTQAQTAAAPYQKPANTKEAKALERKLRKKQQNKDAALRYRMKKKTEGNQSEKECEVLEARNKELREKVDSMTREIDYLKNLMAEVYKAKGLIK